MNIPTFFRFLNKKIEQYDRLALNPFIQSQPIVLIWVEEEDNNEGFNKNE